MFRPALLVLALAAAVTLAWAHVTAISVPVVRRGEIALTGWPVGTPPVTVLLMSDIHVAGPDMPPERLRRVVRQANALQPDIVLIAGDFISEKRVATNVYSMAEAIQPLEGLRPRIGTFAVLGNHDHWADAGGARTALRKAGVRLLENDAVKAGPLAIGGIDDDFTGRADVPRTAARLKALSGPKLLLSHSPDPFPGLPGDIQLMLAGHTHCGQIALPLMGAITTMSRHGKRYACGLIRERGRTLVVTAGLGTSGLPLRLGAVSDMWLLTLRGA